MAGATLHTRTPSQVNWGLGGIQKQRLLATLGKKKGEQTDLKCFNHRVKCRRGV